MKEGKFVQCPKCENTSFVPDTLTDVRIRCSCGNVFKLNEKKEDDE
jgi:predicted nucleic-acid-binding Zn-ribbon protein